MPSQKIQDKMKALIGPYNKEICLKKHLEYLSDTSEDEIKNYANTPIQENKKDKVDTSYENWKNLSHFGK